jgi:hypothetical protein
MLANIENPICLKNLKILFLSITIVLSACETRDLEKHRSFNKHESIKYHERLLDLVEKGVTDPDIFIGELNLITQDFCSNGQCMFVNIKILIKGRSEPIEMQYGDDNLKGFAVTERDSVFKQNIYLKILHGLIYEHESQLPSKGSQIRGEISNFINSPIDRIETISIIEFLRKKTVTNKE